MKSTKYSRFELSLETLCPVSIGAGQEKVLSPYADYVVSKDHKWVSYLDPKKLEAKFEKYPTAADSFADGIASMDNNRSNFNLSQFIQKQLHCQLIELQSIRLPSKGLRRNDRLLISQTIRAGGRPFIPGSSIKGSLKTAMVYDWLRNDEKGGQKKLEEWMKQVATCYRASEKDLDRLERLMVKQRTAKLGGEEFGRFRYLQRKVRENIRDHIRIDDAPLFGSIRDRKRSKPLDSHLIRISDTQGLSNTQSSLAIYLTHRLNIFTGKLTVPQVKEAIIPGQKLSFSIELLRQL